MLSLQDMLSRAVRRRASDILLVAGLPLSYKIDGVIHREEGDKLTPADTAALIEQIYRQAKRDESLYRRTGDDDFAFALPGLSRFRVNVLRQRGSPAAVIRVVTFDLPDRASLHIPDAVMSFAQRTQGLVLVTGPAGSGKSTTLACLIDAINSSRSAHIITIEDPIEFLHPHKHSVVTQRELAMDTASYSAALRAAMRQAPDVILVGEMRDEETIRAAITAAETGHLVFSTLHTLGASHTIDRIIDFFSAAGQQQIRLQLSMVLQGVISQQLLPAKAGGQTPAFEIMQATSAVRNLIREAKAHQLDSAIYSSSGEGMVSMDGSIFALTRDGIIDREVALRYSLNQDLMYKRLAALPA